jgi:hypothetical protein
MSLFYKIYFICWWTSDLNVQLALNVDKYLVTSVYIKSWEICVLLFPVLLKDKAVTVFNYVPCQKAVSTV